MRELVGETDEPREVALPDRLALAELVRRVFEPAAVCREPPHVRRRLQSPQNEAGALAAEERCALRGNARFVERLLEVDEPRVRPAEDRDLVVRDAERANLLDGELRLVLARSERRFRPVRTRGAERLLGAVERRLAGLSTDTEPPSGGPSRLVVFGPS